MNHQFSPMLGVKLSGRFVSFLPLSPPFFAASPLSLSSFHSTNKSVNQSSQSSQSVNNPVNQTKSIINQHTHHAPAPPHPGPTEMMDTPSPGSVDSAVAVGIIGMGDMGKLYARRISAAGWRYAPRCFLVFGGTYILNIGE